MKKPTKASTANSHLEPFGAAVIQIMEADTDWGPDTAEKIQAAAAELGLATSDRAGYFKRTALGKSTGTSGLARFGEYVLKTLETSKDWDADTADFIAAQAIDTGLATTSRDGMFEGTTKAMRRNPKTPARDFSLGAIEHHGDLNITQRHGAYIVIGFAPDGSHVNKGFGTLQGARGYAKKVNRGGKVNPISESGNLSKKGDRPFFWIDEDTATIHTYKKNGQSAGSYEFNTLSTARSVGRALEKEGYDRIKNPNKQAVEASKRLEGFYARKNPRKLRVVRTNPVISLEEYKP